jgi:glycosyltransferase involved in cell wall biosynthesis
MNNILFSIIIPTYNRADFIGKTIQSILLQTYTNFEIIVVDDGSTDNTEDVVKNIVDKRIFYYKKENAERGAARNYGANKAKGDYLNFFDSDDLAYDNHLQVAYNVIQENNNPEVFALNYEIKNPKNEIIRKTPIFKKINQQLIYGNLLSCNGVFIRKDIASKNQFSEIRTLSASEDYLLWLKMGAKYKFCFSNIKTSIIVEHDNRSVLSMDVDKLILRKKLFLELLLADNNISTYYLQHKRTILSQLNSYISLHIVLIKGKKITGIKYLFLSLKNRPQSIFSKRFLAIIKHLIIS